MSGLVRRSIGVVAVGALLTALCAAAPAAAATPSRLDLNVLLVGTGASDPTTAAWQSALSGEGVAYTTATATGDLGSQTVSLPALATGDEGHFNGVVIADSPTNFAASALDPLYDYEAAFGVRQVDGYMFPSPALGLTGGAGTTLDNTTAQLTAAGMAALPELKGPVPMDVGTFGYPASVVAGTPFAPWLQDTAGNVLAGVYQHAGTDRQANVSELALTFDYNASQTQWLLLAPGLIDWVTKGLHLGLYRNYFGEDVDDLFIADNEWSSQLQCTPAATEPVDVGCPTSAQGNPAAGPPDSQMTAADVAYVANWEKQTGITLEFAFNGVGACTAPSAAAASSANCTGGATVNGTTYTEPGVTVDAAAPDDSGLVNALLANQSEFNWITHTWSHQFLGCVIWQPLPVNPAVAATGGALAAGDYSYEVTAATAYGESEPSAPVTATVAASGSASLSWADAPNGGGPSLSTLESEFTGGSGFWGYNVYRKDPGGAAYGLIGQVAEDAKGATSTYQFTDTGATAPGAAPGTTATFPTATDPGISCGGSNGSGWTPASGAAGIGQEVGLDDAFAVNNGLTHWSPSAVVTGEHSGLENPNMPAAVADLGITTLAADASRQPGQNSIGGAASAPRYPSNIYYNAANWPDQLNEYNTLYVATGHPLGDAQFPDETGRCAATAVTTCLTTPATEATVLASESHIMLSHVLANDPRVGYAHQSDLIGPATQTVNGVPQDYGYTLLTLISTMLSQYNSWYTAPITQVTDASESQILGQQAGWAAAQRTGSVTASAQNGVVTVTNAGGTAVDVPITAPQGTTVNGSAFGESYGGDLSTWTTLAAGNSVTLNENVAPAIISANSATAIVGAPFAATVATTGAPTPALTESGALPAGLTFTDQGNGTALISGTGAAGAGGSYPITITATSTAGTSVQSFTLTTAEAPSITSPATADFTVGSAGNYTVTTTGYPAATITESGALPAGLTFADNKNGTATVSGAPAAGGAGSYPVTISATNVSGSTATLSLTITVRDPSRPTITSPTVADFTLNANGAFAVTATGAPAPALAESGPLPAGLSFTDQGNGTALLSGTPTETGAVDLIVTASNASGSDTQTLTVTVGQEPTATSAAAARDTLDSPTRSPSR